MVMIDNLIIDCTNLCHIQYYPNKDLDEDLYIAETFRSILYKILTLFNKFNPQKNLVIAFDEKTSWRKIYTKNLENCITFKKYKGTRKDKLTQKEKIRIQSLDVEINNLKNFLKQHTKICVLNHELLEADDLIAGFVQLLPDDHNVIVSSDKDFKQLIKNNTKLYNPMENDYRDIEKYNNDPDFFLFEKCFRGDSGDNIISAYPYISFKKVTAAYTDEYLKSNIMNHEFTLIETDGEGNIKEHSYITKDVFEENKMLMDLSYQPEVIRETIINVITNAFNFDRQYTNIKLLKYCGRLGIQAIINDVSKFTSLMNYHCTGLSLASSGKPFSHLLPEFV